jgi:dTDP-4-amino-4,6-dideoxygalactose transaminase
MANKISIPLDDLTLQFKKYRKELTNIFKEVASQAAFIKGPHLEEFEKKFANFIGTSYSIGVASGTDALQLSLLALDIKPEDEIIMPANSFIATAYAACYIGAKPVFVDIDLQSYTIDPSLISKAITKKTKAIIPVHLYGNPALMDKITSIAKQNNLFVIEDAAQAHGAKYLSKRVGNWGIISAFSFYPSKNLGAFGDAGAITTNSKKLADKLKMLREYGGKSKYIYEVIGLNSRLDGLQAKILQMKLKHLLAWNKKRVSAAKYYTNELNKHFPFIITPASEHTKNSIYHLYVIRVPKRDALMQYLLANGIQVAVHYPLPLHLQPSLKYLGYKKGDFPNTELLSSEILSIPLFPAITRKQQNIILKAIKEFYSK